MAIREDLVASAANFLRDPNVASSPLQSRIAFLQAKNLTPEEVDAALNRAGPEPGPPAPGPYAAPQQLAPRPAEPSYYGQSYPPYAWQQQPPPVPRRDWRDWFIMATVVSGISYGAYSLTKRYIYPLVAPPTPERLETDKKAIDDQFEKAFALVEQLAKDTEALKAAEQERTERLDNALKELDSVIADLKTANRRREDNSERVRTEMKDIQASIPKALEAQKEMSNRRLQDLSVELSSLKSLISQRMNAGGAAPSSAGSYMRPSGITPAPVTASSPSTPPAATAASGSNGDTASNAETNGTNAAAKVPSWQNQAGAGRSSFGFGSGMPASQATIPAWQLAASNGTEDSQPAAAGPSS